MADDNVEYEEEVVEDEEEVLEEEILEDDDEEVVEEEVVEEEVVEEEPAAAPAPPQQPVPRSDVDDDVNPHEWEKPDWTKKDVLNQTGAGQAAKSGQNLAAEITNVNKDKDESRDVNYDANPLYLKSTEKGSEARAKGDLQTPITNIAELAEGDEKLAWKKPDWATKGPGLSATGKGGKADLQTPITNISEVAEGDDKLAWKKPAWATKGPGLKATGKGGKSDLQTPITNISDVAEGDDKLAWKKPAWATNGPGLKATKKGEKLKEQGNLERPITFPKGK